MHTQSSAVRRGEGVWASRREQNAAPASRGSRTTTLVGSPRRAQLGAQLLPLPLAASTAWNYPGGRGELCTPKEHCHSQHCGTLSISGGEVQAAAGLLMLSGQKKPKMSW